MSLIRVLLLCSGTKTFRSSFKTLCIQRKFTPLAKNQNSSSFDTKFQCNFSIKQYMSTNSHNKEHHHTLWITEKLGSMAIFVLVPSAIICPSCVLDVALSTIIAFHHSLGIKNILEDYARPAVVGKFTSKLSHLINCITTGAALIGFIIFSKNQMRLGEAIKLLWGVGGKDNK